MYEQFYGLSRTPFSLTPDPKFLYLTSDHRDAVAGLTYGILSRKGITVLTGDAGTGKTTVLRTVMHSIPEHRVHFSFLLNPTLTREEFFRVALADFGLAAHGEKDRFLALLQELLLRAHKLDKSVVLVVDEAHRLTPELLEEIRLLSNFETDSEKLLQILLIGQDELDVLLDRHDLRQLKQRIAIRLRVGPLTTDQIQEYISHRWGKASAQPVPFDAAALEAIAAVSCGIPRLINAVCDNALLHGFAAGLTSIPAPVITAVARELHLVMTAAENGHPRADALPIDTASETPVQPDRISQLEQSSDDTLPLASLGAYMPRKRWRFGN